jgi:hypothetical protein
MDDSREGRVEATFHNLCELLKGVTNMEKEEWQQNNRDIKPNVEMKKYEKGKK